MIIIILFDNNYILFNLYTTVVAGTELQILITERHKFPAKRIFKN